MQQSGFCSQTQPPYKAGFILSFNEVFKAPRSRFPQKSARCELVIAFTILLLFFFKALTYLDRTDRILPPVDRLRL